MRRNDDARVLGPYAEKDRWRLVILEKGVRRSEYLTTEKEAQKRKAHLTKRMESLQEYTVSSLITAYTEEKEGYLSGIKSRSRQPSSAFVALLYLVTQPGAVAGLERFFAFLGSSESIG